MAVYAVFEDSALGLDIRGYKLVPNDALLTRICIYTSEIVEAVLSEHPEIVGLWLKKLHDKYLTLKRSCEFENDPVACFNLLPLKQFEKHFQSWQGGSIITISLPKGSVIRVSNVKRQAAISGKSIAAHQAPANPCFVCSICSAAFKDGEEYSQHRIHETEMMRKKAAIVDDTAEKKVVKTTDIPPNPIWWLSYP